MSKLRPRLDTTLIGKPVTQADAGFYIPPPARWPKRDCRNVRGSAGSREPNQVSIFDLGTIAAMVREDALVALLILDVKPDQWRTSCGYPAFGFSPAKIPEYQQKLVARGYQVTIFQPRGAESETVAGPVIPVPEPINARADRYQAQLARLADAMQSCVIRLEAKIDEAHRENEWLREMCGNMGEGKRLVS